MRRQAGLAWNSPPSVNHTMGVLRFRGDIPGTHGLRLRGDIPGTHRLRGVICMWHCWDTSWLCNGALEPAIMLCSQHISGHERSRLNVGDTPRSLGPLAGRPRRRNGVRDVRLRTRAKNKGPGSSCTRDRCGQRPEHAATRPKGSSSVDPATQIPKGSYSVDPATTPKGS